MPTATIPYNFDATRETQISKKQEILKWVIKLVILCRKHCIALRDHREGIHNSSNNCGTFLATLKLLSQTNSNLIHQLGASSA